jgi:hypothetical protein
MTTAQASPDTVLALLFGPGEGTLYSLARAMARAGSSRNLDRVLGGLPKATHDAAAREVTIVTAGLLDISPIDLLAIGWREHADLKAAARRTLAERGSSELVHLVTHRVSVAQQPYVAVLVDGRQVAAVRLGLSVIFDVSGMLARVRAGKLAGIHSGSCNISATLAVDEIEVASKQAHLELPGEVTLNRELRLLPAASYPTGEEKVGR